MKKEDMSKIMKEGTISHIKGGDTKHTFLLVYRDKRYILRKFSNKNTTDYYTGICKKLHKYEFLPKILYQNEKNVLFEYIEGRDCTKLDASHVAIQIGRICGLINKLKNTKFYDVDKRFFSYIETIKRKKSISKEKASDIRELYLSLKKKVHPKVKLDANDVYPENFRLKNGKVYLVDIEAIKPLFQGHGIAKSFVRWFKTSQQREKFKRGYKSATSINFLTEDYLKFLYLNFFVRSIAIKIRLNIQLNPYDITRLNLLLEGKLKELR